ncbi:hypothetical protein KAJ27_08770 [bacterium]|nr:hypothetical protein [bacterium]
MDNNKCKSCGGYVNKLSGKCFDCGWTPDYVNSKSQSSELQNDKYGTTQDYTDLKQDNNQSKGKFGTCLICVILFMVFPLFGIIYAVYSFGPTKKR